MADIGYVVLILALVAAIYSIAASIFGARRGNPELVASGRKALLAVCVLVSIASATFLYSIITHDFQIEYVASYTSRDMPLVYLFSSFWAGNAGSLLFWAWLITVLGAVAVIRSKSQDTKELLPYFSAVVMFTAAFFLIVMIATSNPFQKLPYIPADGAGLNPMLENPGMIFHPPILLLGYAGFTIPFAFAIAALITKRLGNEWVKTIRRWTLFPWLMLGMGIVMGMWWAYIELGWGGYWAWDPVENASLMPWLTGTAFLHSIIIQRRRNMLKVWNIVLIILTFTLCLFGTFLTRSNIISSVHAFSSSALGPFFLAFMGIVMVGSLGLLYYRWDYLKSESQMDSLVSRESSFLLNNLMLVGAAFAVFLGTVFPLISEAVRGVKITVAAPFFNQVLVPIFAALILLTGICVFLGWRRTTPKKLIRNFLLPVVMALILCLVLVIVGIREWYALTLFPLCAFVAGTHLFAWYREVRARRSMRSENYPKAFWNLLWSNMPRYGGLLVHLGIVLMAVGIIGSSFYSVEQEAILQPGESMTIKNYTLTYESISTHNTIAKSTTTATLSVYTGQKLVAELTPAKFFSNSYGQSVTEVDVRTTLIEDLYISLVGWDDNDTATFQVLVNPLVVWIWIGGGVILLGGLIAFWPERRNQR